MPETPGSAVRSGTCVNPETGSSSTVVDLQRVSPVRGIIPLHNHRGKPYAAIDLCRWLRLNRLVYKAEKVDLLGHGDAAPPQDLFDLARRLEARLSWRTDCSTPPPDLRPWRERGLFDVFLAPLTVADVYLDTWLAACRAAELPVRVQVLAPLDPATDPEDLARRLAEAGVCAVNVSIYDAFQAKPPARDSQRQVALVNALARALDARAVEANLVGLPFCHAAHENWPSVQNSRQFFLDHQQYLRSSFEIARRLYRRSPTVANKALIMLLAQYTVQENRIDSWLLPWMLERPWLHARATAWRKLTRHLRLVRHVPAVVAPTETAYRREQELAAREERHRLGPVCSMCSLRRICDRITPELGAVLPGLRPEAQPGDLVTSVQRFAESQSKHYDAVDAERHRPAEGETALVETAVLLMMNTPPTRLLGASDYGVESAYFDRMEGGVRWFSFANAEKRSTILGRFEPPFTLSTLVAGGMADFVGFSVGRFVRLLCPMEAFRHELALHVAEDGRFVLLRDGVAVRPAEFDSQFYVPRRLGSVVEPRLSIWNIDGNIVTQTVRVWEGAKVEHGRPPVKYSVVIVCTRYSRRLQATLRSIAHQRNFDLRKLELVIGYVPGLDPTDDILDSLQFTFPELRIVRSPFPPERAFSKGFMINESARMASGEWIALMDADIVLHPDMFATVERESAGTHFVFPDGRKMLTRETTAKVLLGEIEPWNQWQELMDSPGEHRRGEARGIPIGFFQCVKAECFNAVKYREVEHFEWADMQFGVDCRAKFGLEKKLSLPVAHLDHGGSRWYGTQQQF